MIDIKSSGNKTLNIVLANTNKALREVLKDITPKELALLAKAKDLGSVLESLIKKTPQDATQNRALLTLLKNNPTLKSLGNVTTSLKELAQLLDTKLPKEPLPALEKLQKILTTTLGNNTIITEKALKNRLENSGIFLESKLKNFTAPKIDLQMQLKELAIQLQDSKVPVVKTLLIDIKALLSSELFTTPQQNKAMLTQLSSKVTTILDKLDKQILSHFDKTQYPKDILFTKETKELYTQLQQLNKPEKLLKSTKIQELFSDDFKAVIKKSLEELNSTNHPQKLELIKQLDKLSLQIDYYQLLSHLSNASAIYLPYYFDALEDGNITLKSAKNEKFFCDIELQLKEYGFLRLRLGMFEKNQLNINIECESVELETKMKSNIGQLKGNLLSAGIHPKDIRFIKSSNENAPAYTNEQELQLGFEVKA
ncbi:flagellar hook-length control protein FliK [Sulfurimonas indica]|uniref:flagellar hook-length control protein FliK n=1 Tax=Sulfurimonas indica TaxID=2508707 RepID=UPI0012656DC3|nr:flagellar hook-length control protein FliK [Sulfurimonas indica]